MKKHLIYVVAALVAAAGVFALLRWRAEVDKEPVVWFATDYTEASGDSSK